MSIRIFNHVGYMINVPLELKHKMISSVHVATHLNRAGKFYSIGMRAYYFTVPLVFWLFGPHFMFVSTIGLLIALYRIDRAQTSWSWITRTLNRISMRAFGRPLRAISNDEEKVRTNAPRQFDI